MNAQPKAVEREISAAERADLSALTGLAPIPPISARAGVVPVRYQDACKAIAACITIEDTRQWANKADALAAWAKMYRDDTVSAEARRLKLHAYRRMAALADELCPNWRKGQRGGPQKVLREHGMTGSQAQTVHAVGEVPRRKFDQALKQPKPPSPATLVHFDCAASPGWARMSRALSVVRAIGKHNNARQLARTLDPSATAHARVLAVEALEWLRTFERELADR